MTLNIGDAGEIGIRRADREKHEKRAHIKESWEGKT